MFRCAVRAALLTGALLLAGPAAAWAATVTVAGGQLTYAAAAGRTNDVTFGQIGEATVRLTRRTPASGGGDDDPIPAPDAECVPDPATVAEDLRCTGVERIEARGGDRDDRLEGSADEPLAAIGATLRGETGDDTLTGGGVGDLLVGAAGADRLAGGAGDDELQGHTGADRSADDALADVLAGEAGNDVLDGGDGPDDLAGGTGFDRVTYLRARPLADTDAVSATPDGAADDGETGEGDTIRTDVEDLTGGDGPDRLDATAVRGPNLLRGGAGDDTLDPGPEEDRADGGDGDDTLLLRDGFADRAECGEGDDRVVADGLDVVEASCERVEREEVAGGRDVPEDRPPTVAFTSPAPDTLISTGSPRLLTADAADDLGVAGVDFLDDGRVIATDVFPPYAVPYLPSGDDVGRNTLAVRAVDAGGQTTTAFRTVRLGRFAPAGLTARTTPPRDRFRPFRFRTTGRLALPLGVTPAQGCRDGRVTVRVRTAGRKTVSSRTAFLRADCSFASTVTFRQRRRLGRNGRLTVRATFGGTAVLAGTRSPDQTVRAGR